MYVHIIAITRPFQLQSVAARSANWVGRLSLRWLEESEADPCRASVIARTKKDPAPEAIYDAAIHKQCRPVYIFCQKGRAGVVN